MGIDCKTGQYKLSEVHCVKKSVQVGGWVVVVVAVVEQVPHETGQKVLSGMLLMRLSVLQ